MNYTWNYQPVIVGSSEWDWKNSQAYQGMIYGTPVTNSKENICIAQFLLPDPSISSMHGMSQLQIALRQTAVT